MKYPRSKSETARLMRTLRESLTTLHAEVAAARRAPDAHDEPARDRIRAAVQSIRQATANLADVATAYESAANADDYGE